MPLRVETALGRQIRVLHHFSCVLIAVLVAHAFITGRPGGAIASLFPLAASLLLVRVSPSRRPSDIGEIAASSPLPHRRKRPVPGYHAYVRHRLGSPRYPLSFLRNFFLRPLCARSFGEFWQIWNPPYTYLLLFYVYRPLRVRLPRPLAVMLTFLASGFLLHDLPFNLGGNLLHGEFPLSEVTILFAVFGVLTLISEALPIDYSRRPPLLRALFNAAWLIVGFAARFLIVSYLKHA